MATDNTVTVKEAAELLGINQQAIRERMLRGLLPIGIVVRCTDKGARRPYTYHIYREWLNRFLQGDPVTIPDGISDIDPDRGRDD